MSGKCCAFGHRNSSLKLCADMRRIINDLIENDGVDEFLTYGMGNFDKAFVSAVINARKTYKNIRLVLVAFGDITKLRDNQEYYKNIYDDIIVPFAAGNSGKNTSAADANDYLIKQCDYIISGVFGNTGKAYSAVSCAKRNGKTVIPLNCKAMG